MQVLNFIPRTQIDANRFNEAIEASDYYAEWNTVEGYFSFEEGNDLDSLEIALQAICDENRVSGHFEAE